MKKILYSLIAIIIIFSNLKFVYADDIFEEDISEEDISEEDFEEIILASHTLNEEPTLNSRIAIAYDRTSGKMIWGKDENKRTAMASTTKIMTAIIVVEKSNLDDIVTISSKAAGTGGSRLGLKKEDKISMRDLLYGLMLRSGNDAAVAIAEHIAGSIDEFAILMNEKAAELNLKDTHFVTPHGLDDPDHYTTAYELAKIADYALKNNIIAKVVATKLYTININGYPKSLSNTNELLGTLEGVNGVKTGFTNNAGRCLVTSIDRKGFNIITVVIQADTKKDRTKDSMKLIEYVYENYEKVNIKEIVDEKFEEWSNINKNRINIYKAKDSNINLKFENLENDVVVIKKKDLDNIKIEINSVFNLEAPIKSNTVIGKLKVIVKDNVVDVEDIYIENNIEKKDVYDYILECFKAYTYMSRNLFKL